MLDKYNHSELERKHYPIWAQRGYFQPDMAQAVAENSFSIQLPPPNVTGTLHMGHAFNQTIMDGLARFYRMSGKQTCWIPGTDHAGIATQIVVERQLAAQGVSRHDLGREAFLEKVWQWKEKSGGMITQQMRRVGCSADWSREYFTMDAPLAKAVTQVFVKLYEQGLIYRGKRLVNWDPVLGTAVSDLEVENVATEGSMWHIRYPLADNPNEAVIVATTRPETLLGDVAVAVHPQDERYTHLIGKQLILPLTGRTIEVIADEYVDKDFGSGCVKITPAHDFNDYEVGKRHNTALINVLSLEAKILPQAQVCDYLGKPLPSFRLPEQYTGLDRFAARKQIVADLAEQGLLADIKPHQLMTPTGDRTGSVIEPMLTNQWFVAMNAVPNGGEPESEFKGKSLADKARFATESGQVKFIPENWINTYNQWMNNLQDWCISRQLWWGHQIPAWYDEQGNIYVAASEAQAQAQAGERTITRDEDVLDTWFSSALVPFSTLGWQDGAIETAELKAFLPSSVLVTGYEIIFFWVARMIMMTTHFVGKVPFHDVYIHGMVRDHEGRKMSKSEGNVIDPVDLIDGIGLPELLDKRITGLRKPETAPKVREATEKLFPQGISAVGADALRFTMASYASLGRSVNFDFKRAEGYRNFCNKIWNATVFVLMNTQGKDCGVPTTEPLAYSFIDQWIIGRIHQVTEQVTQAYESYRFDLVAEQLYSFIWNDYCDWYLELAKVQLQSDSADRQRATRHTLLHVLEVSLRLLHPIMPFITEELWQVIAPMCDKKVAESIMIAPFPVADKSLIKETQSALTKMATLQDLIGAVRNLRGEMGIAPSTKAPLFVESADDLADYLPYLPMMARLTEANQVTTLPETEDAPVALCNGARLMLKVEVDKAAETARLKREAEKLQKVLDKLTAKLGKPGYIDKAPAHLVEKDKAELADLNDKMEKVEHALAKLA